MKRGQSRLKWANGEAHRARAGHRGLQPHSGPVLEVSVYENRITLKGHKQACPRYPPAYVKGHSPTNNDFHCPTEP